MTCCARWSGPAQRPLFSYSRRFNWLRPIDVSLSCYVKRRRRLALCSAVATAAANIAAG